MRAAIKKQPRIKKTMEFDASKLKRVRQILGSESDTQAIDQALSLVLANEEIQKVMKESFGALPDFDLR